jgi:hypothetical protein
MDEHPLLFAGFNADPINGDEADGAGTNWPIWPLLFDSFIGLTPLIVSEEMLDVFDECPDVVIARVDNVALFAGEDRLILVGGGWPEWVLPATSSTLRFPWEQRGQTIGKVSATIAVDRSQDTITLPRPARVQAIGRRR